MAGTTNGAKQIGLLNAEILRTYAVTIAGTTDSVRIPPSPLPPLIRGVATAGGIVQSAETAFSA
jgi:hypothetical protein